MTAAAVYERVAGLDADAFEIFVCDAIAELLGVRVRRSRGGYQAGRDGSTPDGLMVECKRYLASRLSDRELVGELHAAHEGGCELWVLAATVEVSEQTASRLHAAATKLGLMLAIIDWPHGQAKPLEALVWAAPETARKRLGITARMLSAREPARRGAVDRLRQSLDVPWLSLDRLHKALAEKLTASLSESRGMKELGARPPASTITGGLWSGFVDRRQVDAELNKWWRGRGSRDGTPAVLLGDEGVGKSLTALNWLRTRSSTGDIVISISSNLPVTSDDPFHVLAEHCRRQFGDSAERWRDRLVRILPKVAARGLRMLIYLDGINEQPDAPWVGLLKAFQAPPFAGTACVLLSCRPWSYTYRFASIASLDRPPQTIAVGLFTDDELRAVLHLHGRRRSEFPTEMRSLLARPRLLAMALRNEAALRAAGEYTVARLFWEDWRDRISAGRQIVNATQYRHALVHIARALDRQYAGRDLIAEHQTLSEALKKAQVGVVRTSVTEQTFSEIVDGGLARLDEDLNLRLDPVFTALALGLELRNLLIEKHRSGAIEHLPLKDEGKIALEPWGGADFGAEVARFAAWASVEMADTPTTVQSAILAVWLDEQNYAETHREDASAIIRRNAQCAFEAAEDVWLHEPGKASLSLQRAFEAAIAPDHAGGTVRREMIARVCKWAGWISLDRKVSEMIRLTKSEQRERARLKLRSDRRIDFEPGTDFELCGVTLRISEGPATDGDAAATFGLDTLVSAGSGDLTPIVVAAAAAGVVDMPEDLSLACIRMLRRLEPESLSIRDELNAVLARFARAGDELSAETADNLAFLLDLSRSSPEEAPHPATSVFWPGAAPVFRERLPDDPYLPRLDEHLLQEALLELDAVLSPALLKAADERGSDRSGGLRPVDFTVVKHAAIARGLVPSGPDQPPQCTADIVTHPTTATSSADETEVASLLEEALFGSDRRAAIDLLATAPGNSLGPDQARLIADEGVVMQDGVARRFDRDSRVLSGRWLAELFRDNPDALAGLSRRLLDHQSHIADGHLQHNPGLLFGMLQATLLLELKDAPALWTAATSNWQDYHLVSDRRIWYFDLPFEAPDSPRVDHLRQIALDAADSEDRLLDICLSVRQWSRDSWLRTRIDDDLASRAPWRMARALVLQGMMGRDSGQESHVQASLAPAWLQEVGVAAFRLARREARMRSWIQLVIETKSTERAFHAARVLEADADRRFSGLLQGLDGPSDRLRLLKEVSQVLADRDSHAAGMGLLEFFLGIQPHPWLGPPGLARSPFH